MDTIEIYQLKEVVGRGGMSTVYRAYDTVQGYEVALKLMHESLSGDEKAKERFSQEVRFVMALQHPAIVPVLDFGEIDGRLFIVMPYLSGGSLRERLQDGPLDFEDAIEILERIVSALDAAHSRHIIHRDIKPHNILLDENGQAYLSDFGVARLIDPERSGETITLVGTPEYIAPEQILGQSVATQTDVYQLGVTVFQMLAGKRPFTGSSIPEQHLNRKVPSAEALNPVLPEGFDLVIRRAMAKDMNDRYPTPIAFLEGLTHLNEIMAVTAFTPWSLQAAEQAASSEPANVKRFEWRLTQRLVSFAAIGLIFLGAIFFTINAVPVLEDTATPIVQMVAEIFSDDDIVAVEALMEQIDEGPIQPDMVETEPLPLQPVVNDNGPNRPPSGNNGRPNGNGPDPDGRG